MWQTPAFFNHFRLPLFQPQDLCSLPGNKAEINP
jgi:hypothetical protein